MDDTQTPIAEVATEQAQTESPEVAQAAPTEEVKEEAKAPAPTAEDVKAHERFIAAAKREKALREKERAIKAQSEEVAKLKAAHDRVKSDPLAALEELGLTYEQITNLILEKDLPAKEPSPAEIAQKLVKEELARYQEEMRKAQEQEQLRNYERTVASVKSQVADIASKAGEQYELVHSLGASDRVWSHIEETFEKTGKALPLEQAIADVEAELESELKQRILGLKKVSKLMAPQAQAKEQRGASPTLTNKVSSESGAFQTDSYSSDDDMLEKIAKQLVWK